MEFFADEIFGPQNKQRDIFNHIGQPCCDHVMEGYTVTVFCYGQSGIGKTYTMFGPDQMYLDPNARTSEVDCGMVPRAARYIFTKADADPNIDLIIIKASCLEGLNLRN